VGVWGGRRGARPGPADGFAGEYIDYEYCR